MRVNIIQPLVQKRVVSIPPAVTLFGMVAAGLLFGFMGVLFAAPACVVAYVLVKRLYVREILDTPTSVPGEELTAREAQQRRCGPELHGAAPGDRPSPLLHAR